MIIETYKDIRTDFQQEALELSAATTAANAIFKNMGDLVSLKGISIGTITTRLRNLENSVQNLQQCWHQ